MSLSSPERDSANAAYFSLELCPPMNIFAKHISVACLLVFSPLAIGQETTADVYTQHVKPLLKERCFACHGALKQEADLRLDTVEAMNEHGIIEFGDLLDRLTSEDDDLRMPPEGEPLTSQQIDLVKKWLAAGAPAPENEQAETDPAKHWAFQRIERPAVPAIDESNPIDAFLAARQKANGFTPQKSARRSLLIRRLYLDVTGLPPTAEELRSEEPVDVLIDSLLASPQYGERWGRHWMDIWRYSDWYGLGNELRNSQKHLWHWRDWIVQSLNEDKGYDRMVMEMLAGDEIAPQDLKTVAATGFLARNYYLFNRTTWLDDTIEHTSKAFLGLTMNCAKCHDHKYDPIGHEDYYRFRAVFEPHHVRLDALPGESDYNKNALPRVYDDKLNASTYIHKRGDPSQPIENKPIAAGPPKFLASFAPQTTPINLPVEAWAPGTREYVQTQRLREAEIKSEAARRSLEQLKRDNKKASVENNSKPIAENSNGGGEELTDHFKKSQPDIWETVGQGWRYQGGLLSQTAATMERSCLRTKAHHPQDFDLTLKFQTTGGKQWKSTGIRFDADKAGENAHTVYVSAHAGGPKVQLAHTIAGKRIYPQDAKIDLPIQLNQEYELNVKVQANLINVSLDGKFLFAYRLPHRKSGSIELFAFDSTADFYSIELKSLPAEEKLKETGKTVAPVDSDKLIHLAAARLKLAEAELEAIKARIAADNLVLKGLGDGSVEVAGRQQLLVQLAQAEVDLLIADATKKANAIQRSDQAKAALTSGKLPTHAHLRGSERALDQKTSKASAYSPVYPPTSTGRRTALAAWITHRDNPLTARVAVNHIWMRHFGAPLVDSVFDFGRRAPEPLHQDLLDYLAAELIDTNWSMKHLHRLILTSKAWQRSSSNLGADVQTLAKDPKNRYYWRMNNRRMESQVLRDSLLHLGGKLDQTRGGPSIPPGPTVRRRSLYLFHSKDTREKFLSTFDDADVFNCYRRSESIVPQQALAMMNSRDATAAAETIVSKFKAELTDGEFAQAAFWLLLARAPTGNELDACLAFLKENPSRVQFVQALLNHNDFLVIR